MMLIKQIYPEIIQRLSTLRDCLKEESLNIGFDTSQFDDLISIIPCNLLTAGCFLDRIKGLWRYEFGLPSDLSQTNKKLWGTQIWPPVNTLFQSILCAKQRLPSDKLKEYMQRLANINKHQDALVEMFPVLRLHADTPANFEVAGEGCGNKTIDWKIGPINDRYIRVDVKNRMSDLYDMMDRNVMQEPQHDSALLFRSIEDKFLEADPEQFLQGVWVVTQVKQELAKLRRAFDALYPNKIHFAIFGDHRNDAFILVKRQEDEAFIRDHLILSPSERFTFITPVIEE
jgi:hypothetical protein